MVAISVNSLTKTFGRKRSILAVDDVDFEVREGEMLVLVGPSGCGKTTTLRCLAGLEHPDKGRIQFGDELVFDDAKDVAVPIHRRDIGLVFQSYALWPHMSARRNIGFPLRTRGVERSKRAALVAEIGRTVDLSDALLDKRPAQLSGGQQQRVALARALVSKPGVVLFDEPLSNLDVLLREQLRSELRRLHLEIGFTAIYVTHDLSEAMILGDRVAAMVDGRIAQIGRPSDIFERPTSSRVAQLLGFRLVCTMVWNDGRWTAKDCDVRGPAPDVGGSLEDGTTGRATWLDLLARPERLSIKPADAQQEERTYSIEGATVDRVAYLGSEQEVIVTFGERPFRATTPLEPAWQAGDRVRLEIATSSALLFASSNMEPEALVDPVPAVV